MGPFSPSLGTATRSINTTLVSATPSISTILLSTLEQSRRRRGAPAVATNSKHADVRAGTESLRDVQRRADEVEEFHGQCFKLVVERIVRDTCDDLPHVIELNLLSKPSPPAASQSSFAIEMSAPPAMSTRAVWYWIKICCSLDQRGPVFGSCQRVRDSGDGPALAEYANCGFSTFASTSAPADIRIFAVAVDSGNPQAHP